MPPSYFPRIFDVLYIKEKALTFNSSTKILPCSSSVKPCFSLTCSDKTFDSPPVSFISSTKTSTFSLSLKLGIFIVLVRNGDDCDDREDFLLGTDPEDGVLCGLSRDVVRLWPRDVARFREDLVRFTSICLFKPPLSTSDWVQV